MEENKKILILDNSGLSFTGNDLDGKVLRGTETSLILLAEQFVKKKIDVFAQKATKIRPLPKFC